MSSVALLAGAAYVVLLGTPRSQKLRGASTMLDVVRRAFRFLGLDTLLAFCLLSPPGASALSDEEVTRQARGLERLARRPRGRAAPIDGLPVEVLFEVAAFWTARDLLNAAVASPSLLEACLAPPPWRSLEARLPAVAAPPRPVSDARQRFFERVLGAARAVAADAARRGAPARVVVAVDGRAVDVSAFADRHPGGRGVMDYYNGRDASVALRSFDHSAAARRLMTSLVVFDPVGLVGRAGVPRKVLDRARGAKTAARRGRDRRRDIRLEKLELRQSGVFCVPRRYRPDPFQHQPLSPGVS